MGEDLMSLCTCGYGLRAFDRVCPRCGLPVIRSEPAEPDAGDAGGLLAEAWPPAEPGPEPEPTAPPVAPIPPESPPQSAWERAPTAVALCLGVLFGVAFGFALARFVLTTALAAPFPQARLDAELWFRLTMCCLLPFGMLILASMMARHGTRAPVSTSALVYAMGTSVLPCVVALGLLYAIMSSFGPLASVELTGWACIGVGFLLSSLTVLSVFWAWTRMLGVRASTAALIVPSLLLVVAWASSKWLAVVLEIARYWT